MILAVWVAGRRPVTDAISPNQLTWALNLAVVGTANFPEAAEEIIQCPVPSSIDLLPRCRLNLCYSPHLQQLAPGCRVSRFAARNVCALGSHHFALTRSFHWSTRALLLKFCLFPLRRCFVSLSLPFTFCVSKSSARFSSPFPVAILLLLTCKSPASRKNFLWFCSQTILSGATLNKQQILALSRKYMKYIFQIAFFFFLIWWLVAWNQDYCK